MAVEVEDSEEAVEVVDAEEEEAAGSLMPDLQRRLFLWVLSRTPVRRILLSRAP